MAKDGQADDVFIDASDDAPSLTPDAVGRLDTLGLAGVVGDRIGRLKAGLENARAEMGRLSERIASNTGDNVAKTDRMVTGINSHLDELSKCVDVLLQGKGVATITAQDGNTTLTLDGSAFKGMEDGERLSILGSVDQVLRQEEVMIKQTVELNGTFLGNLKRGVKGVAEEVGKGYAETYVTCSQAMNALNSAMDEMAGKAGKHAERAIGVISAICSTIWNGICTAAKEIAQLMVQVYERTIGTLWKAAIEAIDKADERTLEAQGTKLGASCAKPCPEIGVLESGARSDLEQRYREAMEAAVKLADNHTLNTSEKIEFINGVNAQVTELRANLDALNMSENDRRSINRAEDTALAMVDQFKHGIEGRYAELVRGAEARVAEQQANKSKGQHTEKVLNDADKGHVVGHSMA